jgi:hypothetical protein
MAKDKSTNTAPVTTTQATSAPEGWETEATGFPPYWTAEPGKTFKGRVIGYDPDEENDGAFPRFTILATAPVVCGRGPKDDMTEVQIAAGELFNVSQWVQLPLENYMGFEVWVMAKGQRPLAGGKTTWDFDLRVSPETKRLVAERQAKMLAEANAAIPSA